MFLTDTDIFNWNNRVKIPSLFISARYSNISSFPDVMFLRRNESYQEPNAKFRFSFSVSSKREAEFLFISENKLKERFENMLADKKEIKADPKCIESLEKTKHILYKTEYTRFEYQFKGAISSIMAYVHVLEASIKWFSEIWGYDESGNELRLLKFQIGDIVSPKNDMSKDLIITNLSYYRIGNDYKIDYVTSEINNSNSPIITYGEQGLYNEDSLNWSRNDRINKILN